MPEAVRLIGDQEEQWNIVAEALMKLGVLPGVSREIRDELSLLVKRCESNEEICRLLGELVEAE